VSEVTESVDESTEVAEAPTKKAEAPTRRQRKPWTRGRITRWAFAALAAGILAFAAAFAYDASQLSTASEDLKEHAGAAKDALRAGDTAKLAVAVTELDDAAQNFASHTQGIHWDIASVLPWVKNQTVPLQRAGDAVLGLSEKAIGPLSRMENLDGLKVPSFAGGQIDPYVMEPYRETLVAAAAELTSEQEALAAVNLDGTVEAVKEPFLSLQEDIDSLAGMVEGGAVAAQVLPGMLGADGPRTYIVAVQNNAEPRSTGGIPGALLEVTVVDGKFTFGQYLGVQPFIEDGAMVAELTADESRIYTDRMAIYPQDTNFSPEFPRTAELLTAFWQRETGDAPDGVISIDPVALGYILSEMDPVDVSGVSLSGANLSDVLLRDSYLTFPYSGEQDAFFAAASAVLFEQVFKEDSATVVAGMEKAAGEHRLMVWSANGEEQALLGRTGIAGDFLASPDALGIFINDGSGSKIGYYVQPTYAVENRVCEDGTLSGATVTVTLTHSFAGDVAALPEYVAGLGDVVPRGEFHANVVIYTPEGLGVTKLSLDGEPTGMVPDLHNGRTMAQARVVLKPGQTTVLVFDLAIPGPHQPVNRFAVTPGSRPGELGTSITTVEDQC